LFQREAEVVPGAKVILVTLDGGPETLGGAAKIALGVKLNAAVSLFSAGGAFRLCIYANTT
jgi:hypothetical protein